MGDARFILDLYDNKIVVERDQLPAEISESLWTAVKDCTTNNPKDRPTSDSLYCTMSNIAGQFSLEGVMDVSG